jgi:hypothetical protein
LFIFQIGSDPTHRRYWQIFPWGLSGRGFILTIHLHLITRLRKVKNSLSSAPRFILLYQASAGSGSNPDKSKRDVRCQSARFFTFPLSVSFSHCRRLIHSLPKLFHLHNSMSLNNKPTKGAATACLHSP